MNKDTFDYADAYSQITEIYDMDAENKMMLLKQQIQHGTYSSHLDILNELANIWIPYFVFQDDRYEGTNEFYSSDDSLYEEIYGHFLEINASARLFDGDLDELRSSVIPYIVSMKRGNKIS